MKTFIISNILLAFLVTVPQVNGQFQAMIKKATAETADGIKFTVWLERQSVTFEQDTVIYYKVENYSNKIIYLVRQSGELLTDIDSDGFLTIMIPLPFPEGHGDYNYNFTKVAPQSKYQGQLSYSGKKYNEERKWSIAVDFGLVRDITGIDRKLKPDEDPAPLRSQLGERIEVVGLSGLTVDVKK